MSLEQFDPTKAQEAMELAAKIAISNDHEYVTLEHLLAAIIQDSKVQEVLVDLDVDLGVLTHDLSEYFGSSFLSKANGRNPRRTLPLERVVQRTVSQAMFSGRLSVRAVDLLVGLMSEKDSDSHAIYFLTKQGIDDFSIKQAISHAMDDDFDDESDTGDEDSDSSPRRSKAERLLEKFCVNLNEEALNGQIDPLIGRETEVHTLVLTTARRTKNNVIMVGEPGVGKTAVAEGLARMIAEGNVPDAIKGSIVYSLNIGALMAGAKYRGDMEERVKQVIDAIEKVGEEKGIMPILFIDEIHTIMGAGAGSQGALDVANLLKPALAKGKLRCIGGTTYEEYRKNFEKDRALLRRFQKLDILEPSIEDAKRILSGLAPTYEVYHGVSFEAGALDAAVELTARYVTDRMLPDKAIDVIDAAGARQKIRHEDERQINITVGLIEEEVSRIARVPARSIKEDEEDKLARLDSDLHAVVFGQDQAIETIVASVLLSRAGLRDPDKPQGNYLFAGPTGVGKTELTKQLAAVLGLPMHRFDMSEYMEKHSVSKFIGAPPGYVGFGDGQAGSGLLTNAVEGSPHSIILLDEIEKAHPDVFNILLQVMDNGQLTNSSGKTVNFRNTILIMTTNAGASELQKNSMGFGGNSVVGNDDKIIERMFTPEFRNRLDAIVKFNSLQPDNMLMIVDKFINKLNTRAKERKVDIILSDEARHWLAEKGYDPKMGARPLDRLIQKQLSEPLSRLMLFGEIKNGGIVHISVSDDKTKLMIDSIPAPAIEPILEEVQAG